MIPVLLEGSATRKNLQAVSQLVDCTSCKTSEELNGAYECEFTYPVDGVNYEYITENKFLAVISPSKTILATEDEMQYYQICERSEPLHGETTFYCKHIRHLMQGYICPSAKGTNLTQFLDRVNGQLAYMSCPFKLFSDGSFSKEKTCSDIRLLSELIAGKEGSILDTHGGEWIFNNYSCILVKNRGVEKNIVLQYGYDIKGYDQTIDATQAYTHVMPYYTWAYNDKTVYITLTQKELNATTLSIGWDDFVQIDDNFMKGRDDPKIYPVNLAEEMEINLNAGYAYFNISGWVDTWIDKNKASLLGHKVSGKIDLALTKDNIALNQCSLGDSITIRIPQRNIEISQKITKYEFDVLREVYTDLYIGELQQTLSLQNAESYRGLQKNTAEIAKVPSRIKGVN